MHGEIVEFTYCLVLTQSKLSVILLCISSNSISDLRPTLTIFFSSCNWWGLAR